jgi:hypothetical protein
VSAQRNELLQGERGAAAAPGFQYRMGRRELVEKLARSIRMRAHASAGAAAPGAERRMYPRTGTWVLDLVSYARTGGS